MNKSMFQVIINKRKKTLKNHIIGCYHLKRHKEDTEISMVSVAFTMAELYYWKNKQFPDYEFNHCKCCMPDKFIGCLANLSTLEIENIRFNTAWNMSLSDYTAYKTTFATP